MPSEQGEESKLYMIERQQAVQAGKMDHLCDALERWAEALQRQANTTDKVIQTLTDEVRGHGDNEGIKTKLSNLNNRLKYVEACNIKLKETQDIINKKMWMVAGGVLAVGGISGFLTSIFS